MKVTYLGEDTKEALEKRVQKVASAARLSRTEGNTALVYEKSGKYDQEAFEKAKQKAKEKNLGEDTVDPQKYESYSRNLAYIKRVVGMGHESIAEHDTISLALDEVSPIVEHTLIGSRLNSFTIKSRREVDFRNSDFYVPTFRTVEGDIHPDNERLQDIYRKHHQMLFDEYGNYVDQKMKKEDARFVLPYSFYSSIIITMNARDLAKLTRYLLYGDVSNITELRKLGEEFLKIIDEKVPYMQEVVRKNPKDKEDDLAFLDQYQSTPQKNENISIHDRVLLTGYTPNSDEEILISAFQQRYQISHEKAEALLQKCCSEEENFKERLMETIVSKPENRELEQVNFHFEIPIPLAVRTHLERHRMQSLLTPNFVPLWNLENYDIPRTLPSEEVAHYRDIFEKNRQMRDYFRSQGVNDFDLVYFYQAANQCNVLSNVNGRSLAWISRMRCCNKAQWDIRKLVNQMCEEVREVAPLFGSHLGATCDVYGYCLEGKESCGKVLMKEKKGGNNHGNNG